MGRKSTKVNTSQPQRIFTSSSGSSVYQRTNHSPTAKPSTQTTNTTNPTTTPVTPGPSLGDSVKHGMATGVGFGMANAAFSSIFSNMRGDSQETMSVPTQETMKPNNTCESFLNLYTDCLKTQSNLMEDNCEYFLANFKSCQRKNENATPN